MNRSDFLKALLAAPIAGTATTAAAAQAWAASPAFRPSPATPILYRTAKVEGLDIFYREAGRRDAPTILLLHGFPSSSHMFRDLIPLLADRYHVVAPDYPAFGYSSQPAREAFAYTFDNLYAIVDKFTRTIGLDRFAVYIQDYGAPIGLRFALHQPERVTALIVQNGNAYDVGLSPAWAPIKAYWAEDTAERRNALRDFVSERITVFQYSEGVPVERRNPDAWKHDQANLDRPGNAEIQLDLFGNYRTNLALYPAFHEAFRKLRFPTLVTWGKNDPLFTVEGAEAFRRDLPNAEIHLLDAGHFALETHAAEIAGYIRDFLPRAARARR